MEELGRGFYWEEMEIGRRFKTIGRSIFEADLAGFIAYTGMQEMIFNNLVYIEKESATGKRIVPGALVFSVAEGLVLHATVQGTGIAFLGMDLDIKGPVVVNDTIHVEVEVIEQRATSKGNRGLVRTRNVVKNQHGEIVMVYNPLRIMKGRP